MSYTSPFRPMGNSVLLGTSGSANTSISCPITVNDLYGSAGGPLPSQVRVLNTGTTVIWLVFTPVTATAAIPVSGTTTTGTPANTFPVYPAVIEVFGIGFTGNINATGLAGLWCNSISAGVSQAFTLTFGEGI